MNILDKHILQIHDYKNVLDQGFGGTLPTELKPNQIGIAQGLTGVYELMYRDNSGVPHYLIESGGAGITGLNLGDLGDVNTTGESKDLVLKFNGHTWVPALYNASFVFSIASFSTNIGSTINLIGSSGVWSAIGAISFSASYSNGPATGGYVTSSTGWTNLNMGGVGFVGPTTNTEAVNYPAVDGNIQFTLNATDGEDPTTSTLTYYFFNEVYWGTSVKDSGYIASDVTGLAGSQLNNTQVMSFSVNATAGQYIVYSYPSRMGVSYQWVNGFQGGFNAPETVSITNINGYTEDYYVYSSEHSGLGATVVSVTLTS